MITVPIGSPLVVSYMTSIVSNIVSYTVFVIFHADVLWPRSRTVQGYSRSKVMVPINSPWVISYSTSIDPITVSVSIFQYLTCNFDDLELGQVKVIQSQWSRCHLEPIGGLSNTVSLTTFEIFDMCKFCDLDLGYFKVIQGQSSWCQSIAQGRFYLWFPLTPSWYLSPFSRYLALKLFSHRTQA